MTHPAEPLPNDPNLTAAFRTVQGRARGAADGA